MCILWQIGCAVGSAATILLGSVSGKGQGTHSKGLSLAKSYGSFVLTGACASNDCESFLVRLDAPPFVGGSGSIEVAIGQPENLGLRYSALPARPGSVMRTNPSATVSLIPSDTELRSIPNAMKSANVHGIFRYLCRRGWQARSPAARVHDGR